MNDIITDFFEDSITDGFRKFLAHFAIKMIDETRFVQMFVDARQHVSSYEYYKNEENNFRAQVFSEESMRSLARMMRSIDDYSWMDKLEQQLDVMLEGLEENNRQNCKRHFMEIITTSIRRMLPKKYDRFLLQDIDSVVIGMQNQMNGFVGEMHGLNLSIQLLLDDMERRKQEERQHIRQEGSENRESYIYKERATEAQKFFIPEWNLSNSNIEWEPKSLHEDRVADIEKLITLWQGERESDPGLYILTYDKCNELEVKTREVGLLQCHTFMESQKMFDFCFELVWRYERCLHIYSGYEYINIYTIWKAFESQILDTENEERIEKWFDIGLALLRMNRECCKLSAWNEIYDTLHAKESYCKQKVVLLRLEKLKWAYSQMDIPAMRVALGRCHPPKTNYEVRLQLLGMRVELDDAEAVIEDLKQLICEIRQEGIDQPEKYLYFASLQASALQLYSLCVQGVRDYNGEYEAHQEFINHIEDEIEHYKELFDWSEWKNRTENELLRWHVKSYEKKDAFALNRELRTIFGGTNGCADAYRFARLLDRLALPMHCGYVTLLGEWEHPWIEAVMEINPLFGAQLLCKVSRGNTIETLVDRRYLSSLETDDAKTIVLMLIRAFSKNMEEIEERVGTPGGLLARIITNVPELLIRFMSRCPQENQAESLLMLKALMENQALPVSFPMAQLSIGIMQQVSERVKAQMLDTMMQTKIVEHKTLHGHGDGMDIFAFYFKKLDIGVWKKECRVTPDTISDLLEIPDECGYVWQTKALRLGVLYDLELLDEEQQKAYARLLWRFVSEDTGLPKMSNMYLYKFEMLPVEDVSIPVRSVKQWFLSQSLEAQFADEEGCKISMNGIPYLDELIVLCDHMESGYWSVDETEQLLYSIQGYWKILAGKLENARRDSVMWDEFTSRAWRMVQCMAALVKNSGNLSATKKNELHQMINEMQKFDISTKPLEILLEDGEKLQDRLVQDMRSANNELVAGALFAAFQHMQAHPDETSSQMLLDEVLNIFRYRKNPGVLSAAWTVHNLLYAKNSLMQGRNLETVDECLKMHAVALYGDLDSYVSFKEILSLRKACVAIAFQMSKIDEMKEADGVVCWKEIVGLEDEINEVKNEWVW